MIINMSEVNIDNVQDWSIFSLEKFKATLKKNISQSVGQIESQRLLCKLIMLEIDRKNRIRRINLGADLEKAKIIKKAKEKGVDIDI